jgi:Ca2+-transporting ATPase
MPEQKYQIVKTLQESDQIVAMTGDGINDAPALKAANMGIAMGKRGTDVAREAADMILMDDSFLSIVAAIKEGRHIFDNIQKAIGFVLAIHLPIALMAVVPVLIGLPPLLMPVHVVILELIVDPTCTLVFESEKIDDDVMNRPPRNPKVKIFNKTTWIRSLFYGSVISMSVFASYMLGRLTSVDPDTLRTMAFITLLVTNTIVIASTRSNESIFKIIKRPNNAFWVVIVGVWIFLLAAININVVRDLMKLTYLSTSQLGIIGTITGISLVVIELLKHNQVVKQVLRQV